MDFSPADLFRSTKTGSRSSLDRVNKQLSASRSTFRQKVHIGVLLATVALVAYGAIIIWSASQFKADASFSRHLLGIGIGAVLAVLVWRTDLRGISNFSTALLVIDLIVIFSPKIPGLSYTGGLVIRAVTRALVKQTPHIGFAVKALTAAAGTYGMGRALVSLYERDVDYSRANEVVTATFSRVRDLVTTVAGATRPMASYQDASDLAA